MINLRELDETLQVLHPMLYSDNFIRTFYTQPYTDFYTSGGPVRVWFNSGLDDVPVYDFWCSTFWGVLKKLTERGDICKSPLCHETDKLIKETLCSSK